MNMLVKSQDDSLRKRKNSDEKKLNEERKNSTSLKSYLNKYHVDYSGVGEHYRVVHLSCVFWLCFGLLLGR